MNDHNHRVVETLRARVAAFVAGELDLVEIQFALQSCYALLENDGSEVRRLVRRAEAEVEQIRFTQLLDEQRPAVVFQLDELLGALEAELP